MSYQALNKLLEKLNPREKNILLRRCGIQGEEETLESIANDYGLSRERLRQIQKRAENKLLPLVKESKEANQLIKTAKIYLEPIGVKRESSLFKTLKENLNFKDEDCKAFRFLAYLSPEIIFHPSDIYFNNFYARDEKIYTALRHSLKKIYFHFLEKNKAHPEEALLKIVAKEIQKHIKKSVKPQDLIDLIAILKHFAKNPFGFWGLRNHPQISGKCLKDKIYLILKHENRPVHYSKIYQALEEFRNLEDELIHFNWRKNYSLDSIKNELIRHNDFVLVGRGTYGLKEWNLVEGTAKELISKILKEKRRVEIEKLWQEISHLRQINKNTFLIYLKQLKIKKEDKWLIYDD